MKLRTILKILICAILLISGCGYTTKTCFLPSHIGSVYIETFQNQTDQPNLDNLLRSKLISTFQNDGNLKIAPLNSADTILQGQIIGYTRQALRYEDDEAIREYRLQIVVNFKFQDLVKDTVLVEETNFDGDTTFYLTGSSAKTESSARDDALDDLSLNILNSATTLW